MNHYAIALAEKQAQPSHQLKEIGDQWQTPKALFWGLNTEFSGRLGPLVLDLFADDSNALLPNYYTAADNTMTQELAADLRSLGGAGYGNPPYSRPSFDGDGNPITGMDAIMAYCREQRDLGARIMLLIKAATSETWWPEDADFIQFIAGRIGFESPSWYRPATLKDKPSSSGFASAVVIFDKEWAYERRPQARLSRDALITTGQIILDMIARQAELLASSSQPATHEPEPVSAAEPLQGERVKQVLALQQHAAERQNWKTEQDMSSAKSLSDWSWDYCNDQLNLGDTSWERFVAVLTVLYGKQDTYTARNVAVAISISDEQLMDEFTTLSDEAKEQIRKCVQALQHAKLFSDRDRQTAVTALMACIDTENLSLTKAVDIMKDAVLAAKAESTEEAAA